MWQITNIWERHWQIKFAFMKKSRSNYIQGIPPIIRSRIFCLLICKAKNIEVRKHRRIILNIALCGCVTWSLIWREVHSLMVYECSVLRKIFVPKLQEVTGDRDNFRMRNFMICTNHLMVIGSLNKGEWGARGMWHTWGRREMRREFRWGNLKERDHFEDPGVDGRIIF